MVGGDDNGVLNAHFLLRGVGWKVWWKRCGGAASSWLRTRKNTEKFFSTTAKSFVFLLSCEGNPDEYERRKIKIKIKIIRGAVL